MDIPTPSYKIFSVFLGLVALICLVLAFTIPTAFGHFIGMAIITIAMGSLMHLVLEP
jgi:hypothetical protein